MIQVYLTDDHPLVVEGIKTLLQDVPQLQLTGFALSGRQCLAFFEKQSCDVLLLDINLPDISGLELCKALKQKHLNLKILALSNYEEGSYVAKMMQNGADGYLLKNVDKQELVRAIEQVHQGKSYLSPQANHALLQNQQHQRRMPIITKREKEVLALIAEGMTNVQIAERLFVSIDTINSHRKNLLTKTNLNNTAALVKFGVENGWI